MGSHWDPITPLVIPREAPRSLWAQKLLPQRGHLATRGKGAELPPFQRGCKGCLKARKDALSPRKGLSCSVQSQNSVGQGLFVAPKLVLI